ncbi:MAG: hydrogenase maturation nickel metallochaperone HypA [Planctomycetes bacterium]|jgi:hydrogenase nickel incorporation protein HypA/HybF|nr:hydrogenase maturation nickel metallochaperone HypA [Planctomycetota bacterium]
MHEASIMQNVFDLACDRMRAESATRIVRVRLRVGALAGVVPEALAFAFEAMRAGTPAALAEIEFERVPARLVCRACQREFEPDGFPDACPCCGSWNVDVRHGHELDLVLVEFARED